MKTLSYKIVYKNNTSKENIINHLERLDIDAGSIKQQIAKQNGISGDKFKIYAIDPLDSTRIPLSDGQTLTQSYKVVELYEEEFQSEQRNSRPRERTDSDNSLTFEETSQLIVEKSHDYQEIEPEAPPHVYGLFKISRMFKCFSKQRYFQINPDILVINMYENKAKFPKKPQLTIPLLMITKISRLVKTPCFSSKSYMQIITSQNQLMLSFQQKSVCKQWIKLIKQAIEYAKFVQSKRSNLKDKWRPTQQTVKIQLLDESKDNIITTDQQKKSYRSDPSEVVFKQQQKTVLFEHFEFQMKIGNGSFGLVYLATHKQTQKVVAIKQLNKDKLIHRSQLKYAMTQLQILSTVKNPFIISLYYAFQTKDNLYLAMDYCPNGNLKQLIQDNHVLSIEDAVLYICEIIIAIEYLHKRKIIYRDLKPQNILMTQDYHICLSDFGLSKTDVSVNDYAQSFLGTPAYLAPQMATNGKATQATDVYGIGAVMYQMVHGKMLYFGTSISDILNDIQQTEPEIDPKLPKEVKSFLRCTLQKDPQKRIKNDNLRQHPLFKKVNWNGIHKKKVHPKVKQHKERSSIQWDIKNQQIDEDYNQQDYLQNRIEGWLYSKPV